MENSPRERIVALLTSAGTPFRMSEHEHVRTSDEAARVRGVPLSSGAKCLMLMTAEGEAVLAVIPGDARLSLKKLAATVGTRKVHFASHDTVLATMGCEVGACYPFGSLVGLRTIVDPTMLSVPEMDFNPGSHTHSIAMRPADYVAIEKPELVDVREDAAV